jgi:hypothetical protein
MKTTQIKKLMPKPSVTDGNVYVLTENQMEKFAKSIVKTAGKYLMSDEFIGRSDLDWDMVLKEHFGVK